MLVATGANSSLGLRSMPARYLLMDEVDAYPPSASSGAAGTEEGDPVDLAIRPTVAEVAGSSRHIWSPTSASIMSRGRIAALSSLRWAQENWPDRMRVPVRAMPRADRRPPQGGDAGARPVVGGSAGRWRDGWLPAERAVLAADHVVAVGKGLPARPEVAGADADVHQSPAGGDVPGRRQRFRPDVMLPAWCRSRWARTCRRTPSNWRSSTGPRRGVVLRGVILPGDPTQRDLWDAFQQRQSMTYTRTGRSWNSTRPSCSSSAVNGRVCALVGQNDRELRSMVSYVRPATYAAPVEPTAIASGRSVLPR